MDVLFAIDRAGLVGKDGPTHAGSFDLSFLRCIPKMLIMAPADENETRQMLYTGFVHEGPAAVRYPRGTGPGVATVKDMQALPIGKGEICREGKQVAILSFGTMLTPALEAAEQLNATVANMRFVKPLDEELIAELAASHDVLVTIEENAIAGGAGSGVNEVLAAQGYQGMALNLGLPDSYVEHGNPEDMLADCGLDKVGIITSIENRLKQLKQIDQKTRA
ncbi:1-deoxy-D-xylulose 5-phosphate synthase [gamma proteobacterium IMCC2047]|nr:1-deoxy-D-xylulose 5-phosphate synthase [gamma proteobacterium IMCC2047]